MGFPSLKFLLIYLLCSPTGLPQTITPSAPSHQGIRIVLGDSLIDFVSDTQSPLFLETLRIRANDNDEAREMIFGSIIADRPDAIVHLGDLVSLGFNDASWGSVDGFLGAAGRAGIPVYPVLGNHELMLLPAEGMNRFLNRFPWYVGTGYLVRIGRVALVLLNSDLSHLTEPEQSYQRSWMAKTLRELESDSAIGAVIVGCHHSPYTNSTVVSPSEEVQYAFVTQFLRSPKCRLFVSGHAHAFEHFKIKGKDFMVLGGGGALQQPLLTHEEQRWDDLFPREIETRMFHYVQCRLTRLTLEVTVRMLRDDFSAFEDVYRVSIPCND